MLEPQDDDASVVQALPPVPPLPADAERAQDPVIEPDAREDEANGGAEQAAVEGPPKPDVDDAESEIAPDGPEAPAEPPSDGELERKIARKIKKKCATELAGKSATVFFEVTSSGHVKGLSVMPKDAAGECAKQQVVGTRFRTRRGSKDFEIKVGKG
jgi:hypothetical protein